jgi:subtilisin family serine protease
MTNDPNSRGAHDPERVRGYALHRGLDAQGHQEKLGRQVGIVLASVDGAAVHPADNAAEMEYLYREGHILVRDIDLDRVREVIPGEVVDSLVNGLSVFAPSEHATLEALEAVDAVHGAGVATPNHIFYVVGRAAACPATEPDPVDVNGPDPSPVPAATGDGRGVAVSVVDTGFISALADADHPWLEGVTGDEEDFDPTNIGPYVGHGTFVAGIVRCISPNAEVHVEGLIPHGGAITESEILKELSAALDLMPDVISMSAGCTTRHNLPPLGFQALYEHRLRHYKGTVLVAAAGNNSTRQPFWPAAFEWTVSVGALDGEGNRATFSDYGSWVDVYAPGVDLVNAYPNGTYTYSEPPRVGETAKFTNGLALWSGTSFSTPIVSGMIASRMSRTGQSGRQAADSILRIARQYATPGVGAIADPSRTHFPDPAGP